MKQTLAVKRTTIEKQGFWKKIPLVNGKRKGAVILSSKEKEELLNFISTEGDFYPRYGTEGIEENTQFKQFGSYALLKKGDKYFFYIRSDRKKGEGEHLLNGLVSCGIGGHMEPADDTFEKGWLREIDEEVNIMVNEKEIKCENIEILGIVNDDSNAVGYVHFGVVAVVEIPKNAKVYGNDSEITNEMFMTVKEYFDFISNNKYEAETWTQLVMDMLNEK